MPASAWGRAFITTMLLTTGPSALAQTRAWTITPSIGLRGTYNDNVALVAAPAHGDFITDVNPAISVSGRSKRLSGTLSYNADLLFYSRNPEQDRIANTLNGSGSLEA